MGGRQPDTLLQKKSCVINLQFKVEPIFYCSLKFVKKNVEKKRTLQDQYG